MKGSYNEPFFPQILRFYIKCKKLKDLKKNYVRLITKMLVLLFYMLMNSDHVNDLKYTFDFKFKGLKN